MRDVSPKTDRERLFAEIAHAQGLQDGVKMVTDIIIKRGLAVLQSITEDVKEPQ